MEMFHQNKFPQRYFQRVLLLHRWLDAAPMYDLMSLFVHFFLTQIKE